MKIATWNVNSVKARIETVCAWLKECEPDIACFQEIKTVDEGFPTERFEDLGYNCAVHGQKSYNGVAILSKRPIEDIRSGLPEADGDEQARYIEALIPSEKGMVRVASIYAPNGNTTGSEKYAYRLSWMGRLKRHMAQCLAREETALFMGDYNVIATENDAHYPENWVADSLFLPQTRMAYRKMIHLGLTDAFRATHGDEYAYTFWDYQGGAWQKNNGIRIDHILLTPQATDRLLGCGIDKHVRSWDKPSDHVPVWCEMAA
nr:MAG: exodeoxyribonuclease III [Hyphomicrobiales bacterium]